MSLATQRYRGAWDILRILDGRPSAMSTTGSLPLLAANSPAPLVLERSDRSTSLCFSDGRDDGEGVRDRDEREETRKSAAPDGKMSSFVGSSSMSCGAVK